MTSLEMVIIVARKLGSLRDEVAFLGGAGHEDGGVPWPG